MSTDPTVQKLLERNKQHAAITSPLPFFTEFSSVGLTPPHIVVLTCADPRCIPEQFLGLQPVDAVIMRNMCGHAAPALNDILALDHFFGFTDIMVIHHTDCGSLAFTDDEVRDTLQIRQPNDKSIDTMNVGTIKE